MLRVERKGRWVFACGWPLLLPRPDETPRKWLRERVRLLRNWNHLEVVSDRDWRLFSGLGFALWIWRK